MYREICKRGKPTLTLRIQRVKEKGLWELVTQVPLELREKIGYALQIHRPMSSFKNGILEINFPCLKDSSPSETMEKLTAFCRLFSRSSEIEIVPEFC